MSERARSWMRPPACDARRRYSARTMEAAPGRLLLELARPFLAGLLAEDYAHFIVPRLLLRPQHRAAANGTPLPKSRRRTPSAPSAVDRERAATPMCARTDTRSGRAAAAPAALALGTGRRSSAHRTPAPRSPLRCCACCPPARAVSRQRIGIAGVFTPGGGRPHRP